MADRVLLPIVRWAQNREVITLKIELMECKDPKVNLLPDSIQFEGSQGKNRYGFTIDFFQSVKAESVVHKVSGSYVEIFLSKDEGKWWSRLTKLPKAPHFLKLDFEKWKSESEDEEDKEKKESDALMAELMKDKIRYENTLKILKSYYLVLYNAIQWLMHVYIFLFCAVNIFRGGTKVFAHTYDRCCKTVQLAVGLSWMEVIHPYTGITKGSWVTPCIQCFGRSFAMFCLWLAADDIMKEWFITILFMAWSSIELVRYPLYICQLVKVNLYALTWLRYTMWIPLYPLGALMEAILYLNSAYAIESKNLYELQLPNPYNVIFKFTWLIRLQVAALMYSIAFILVPYMWKQRKQRLGGRRKYKQP